MTSPSQILSIAAKYIGVSGTDNIFNTWYWGYHCYDPNVYPWCAAFQSYVAMEAGLPVEYYSASAAGFARQFRRIDDSEVQPGDYVLFTWDGRQDFSWADHIGIVEWSDINDSGYFGTIEGNTGWADGGEVARCTRYNWGSYGTAFYRPVYDGQEGGGGDPSPEPSPSPAPSGDAVWQGDVIGFEDTTSAGDDYAGVFGRAMLYLAAEGVGQYQAHSLGGAWWDAVDHYDLDDEEYGMAGAGEPIDGVRIFDPNICYQTHNLGGDWNDVMEGTVDTGGSGDDYAGQYGVKQDAIRIWRKDGGNQPRYNVFS